MAIAGKNPLDNYNQAVIADKSWFVGLDQVVSDILVWGGGGEIIIDSIRAVTEKMKEAHPRVEYVEQPNAAHEEFILDKTLGTKGKAEGQALIESWIGQRI